MEEMMKMKMKMNTFDHHITPTRPTWKLYENPFYIFHHHQNQQDSTITTTATTDQKQIHRLHLPISSRKIAASFFDLTFIMESERKKMESLNKQLAEERRGREALERVCQDLANQISAHKAEITKMRRDMDEERKMLRTAEVIREERVQMKLSEAKIFLEEKLTQLQINNGSSSSSSTAKTNHQKLPVQPKSCGETENPHIKRGIKGFVEFPKVVRAIGCRSTKHLGSKIGVPESAAQDLAQAESPSQVHWPNYKMR